MPFLNSLVQHVCEIHRLLPLFETQAHMDFSTLYTVVQGRGRSFTLQPQFVGSVDGKQAYSPRPNQSTYAFGGWRPYFNKQWPTGTSKSAFKDYCLAHDLATPQSWNAPLQTTTPYIAKPFHGSFGKGFSGPLSAGESLASFSGATHYCEQFIMGRSAKAWYWDNRLACLYIEDCPIVIANGKNTVRELICARAPDHALTEKWLQKIEWHLVEAFCRFQGVSLDQIPDDGKTVSIDFRFSGFLSRQSDDNLNILKHPEIAGGSIVKQFQDSGPLFWKSIPEEKRLATLYTVDAVVDADEKVWFLELNCNPLGHPDVYRYMFEGFLGPATKVPPSLKINEPESAHRSPLAH